MTLIRERYILSLPTYGFYHEGKLTFIKYLLCIFCDEYVIFVLYSVVWYIMSIYYFGVYCFLCLCA